MQGTMALVTIAVVRSRGDSRMRHPVTPTALHPRPMQSVSACRPLPPHRAMGPSSRKAIRGRKPISSSAVKSGKKITIGGSITASTRVTVA